MAVNRDADPTASEPYAVVTGGAGFIGSHMVELLLARGYRVGVIDDLSGGNPKNLKDFSGDLRLACSWCDIRTLEPGSPIFRPGCLVFHFAGIGDIVPSIERPLDYMDVNLQGTLRVLECARRVGAAKLVYAASSSCYGLASVPTPETHPIQPEYPYALSKNLGEQAALHWDRVYGLPVNSIRIFNAYGPRSRTSGAYGAVFGVFLRQKLANKPFTVVGDGTQTRDFIYAADVARAFLAAAKTPIHGAVWNVGASKPQSVNRLTELLGGERTFLPKRPGEPDCTWADTSKITEELNWKPEVTFEEGVQKVLERIEDWRDAPLWDSKSIESATKSWFQFLGHK